MIRLHDPANGTAIRRWSVDMPLVRQIVFSADGKLLAGASADGADSNARADGRFGANKREAAARVWEVASGKEIAGWKWKGGVSTGLFAIAFAPDGDSVFTTEAAGVALGLAYG